MYDRDSVEFENGTISRVRCTRCGETVAILDEVESKKFPGKVMSVLKRLGNWRQKRLELSDGSYMEPIFCADCIGLEIDEGKVLEQVKRSWKKEWAVAGKDEKAIENKLKDLRIAVKEAKHGRNV